MTGRRLGIGQMADGQVTTDLIHLFRKDVSSLRSARCKLRSLMASSRAISAARNATAAVAMVAEVNNYVLPLWLIVFGAFLLRSTKSLHTTPAD